MFFRPHLNRKNKTKWKKKILGRWHMPVIPAIVGRKHKIRGLLQAA
jgi:hypothetical protein